MTSKAATYFFHRSELSRFEQTCSRILTFCNSNSLEGGLHVHSPIIKLGLRDHLDLSNNLLSLYVKCNKIRNAHQLFDEMQEKDVVSWTSVISAYTKSQKHELALRLFDEMMVSGFCPNEFTFSSVLRSCTGLGDLEYGACLHGSLIKSGYESNPVLCCSLIDLYSKYDYTKDAYELFGCMENRDFVSWTTMISSLVQAQKPREALGLYAGMIESGVSPNEFTFVKLLAASASLGLVYGKLLHAQTIVRGIKPNLVVKTALVDLYSRFGQMSDAMKVVNLTLEFDVFLWTSIISGFKRNLEFEEAIEAFLEMQVSGFRPNSFTYSAMLSLCSCLESLNLGKQIHSQVIQSGLEDNVSIGNALVDMYMKCSSTTEDSLRVFRGMNLSNVISWTALISGLADHGLEQNGFELFEKMLAQGIQPNSVTLCSILRASRKTGSVKQMLELHGYILRTSAEIETMVGNSLVDAYAGLNMTSYALRVIRILGHRYNIAFTSMVTRLNEIGHHEMALNIINHMNHDGVEVDPFSLAGFLSASANLGALETGKHLHGYSVKSGLTGRVSVLNGLVDLYGKCGCIEDAKRAFGEISELDVVSWNGLISALVSNGYISSALSAFDDMRLRGAEPDGVTFLIVLAACCNGNLVEMGLEYFQSMREMFNIDPQIDHYVYLVDLLGRAGRLSEAIEVAETMPLKPNALIFKTLLRACRFHGNLALGEDMARIGLELDPIDPAFYFLLVDLYEDRGRSELAEKTRRLMRERGLKKTHGLSTVETHGKVHNFSSKDFKSHKVQREVYEKVELLATEFEKLGFAYRDKGDAIHHSAKLAIAFGLLSTPQKALIRVVKNKHLCRDCHGFISLASRVADREIVVRDGNRVHKFKNGECSCTGKKTSFV